MHIWFSEWGIVHKPLRVRPGTADRKSSLRMYPILYSTMNLSCFNKPEQRGTKQYSTLENQTDPIVA